MDGGFEVRGTQDAVVTIGAGVGGTPGRPPLLALADLLDGLAGEQDLRAVVVAVEGEAFSGGVALGDRAPGARRRAARAWLDAFERIERLPLPVIAAVRGEVTGWGCELLLAADLVVAGSDARLRLARRLVEGFPAYGLLRGPSVIGAHWTKYLAFTGEAIGAAEAERLGLVHRVTAPGEAVAAAEELAAEMARNAPLGVAVGKSLAGRRRDDGGREHAVEALLNVAFAMEEG